MRILKPMMIIWNCTYTGFSGGGGGALRGPRVDLVGVGGGIDISGEPADDLRIPKDSLISSL